jgi:hypothetical protein
MERGRVSFDSVAAAYDRARPDYPKALFDALEAATRPRVDLATWLVDEQSKSYISALDASDRTALLDDLEVVLRRRFPTGELAVPYETWLWTARMRDTDARGEWSTVAGRQ